MTHSFESTWWTVELPPGWVARREDKCATLRADPQLGVLQISSTLKEVGPVNDDDLRDFANDGALREKQFRKVIYGIFSGFSSEYSDGQLFWIEWWLKNGSLMIYATYNVNEKIRSRVAQEVPIVENILRSLAPVNDVKGTPFASPMDPSTEG